MTKLNLPDWMHDCSTCVERVTALEAAPGEFPLREFEAVREHLVDAHLALLPGYDENCSNCQEWRALGANATPPRIVPVLGREDLLHRAGHLLSDSR